MSYIRIKWIKGHPYLYEQESYRVGNKVKTRYIRYVGKGSLDTTGGIQTPAQATEKNPLDPLIEEARKYTSAEDFAKHHLTLYHGSPNADAIEKEGFKLENVGSNSGYKGTYGEGVYLTAINERAALYGKVVTVSIGRLRLYKPKEIIELFGSATNYGEPAAITRYLKSKGYDGVQVGDEIVVFDPQNVQTKFQLIDLYNQAVGNPLDRLAEEARRYKSAEEFVHSLKKNKAFGLTDYRVIKTEFPLDNVGGRLLKNMEYRDDRFPTAGRVIRKPIEIFVEDISDLGNTRFDIIDGWHRFRQALANQQKTILVKINVTDSDLTDFYYRITNEKM